MDTRTSHSFGRFMQLLLITIAASSGIYARTALSPLQEAIRSAFSLSDNQMALLQGPALALPLVIAAIPLGMCVDRYSRIRLLVIATVLNLVGTVAGALASAFTLLLSARCLVGLAAPATAVAAYSLLADIYDSSQRGRATMLVMLGQVGGSSVAFALGGELLSRFGPQSDAWRWAMLWMAVLLVPVVILTLGLREPLRMTEGNTRPSRGNVWAELRPYRAFLITLIVGMAMVNLADGAVLVWAAPVLARSFALPPDRIGAIMAAALLIGGVGGPLAGGLVADACQRTGGPSRTLAALSVLALLSVPAGCFATLPTVATLSLALSFFLLIGSAINVMVTALSIVVIPNQLRGVCMMLEFAAGALFGLALAPLSISLLSEHIGGPSALGKALAMVCVAMGLLGAVLFGYPRKLLATAAPPIGA